MSHEMKVEHETTRTKGVFYLVRDGERIAHLDYTWPGESRFVLSYVEVDVAHRGKGYARLLIDELARFARIRGETIEPTCSVARQIMIKDPAYRDVLGI